MLSSSSLAGLCVTPASDRAIITLENRSEPFSNLPTSACPTSCTAVSSASRRRYQAARCRRHQHLVLRHLEVGRRHRRPCPRRAAKRAWPRSPGSARSARFAEGPGPASASRGRRRCRGHLLGVTRRMPSRRASAVDRRRRRRPGAEDRRVEYGRRRRRGDDHALVRLRSRPSRRGLVQRLLALVVPAARPGVAAWRPTHRSRR